MRRIILAAVLAAVLAACSTLPPLSRAQIAAIVAAPDRSAGDRWNDARRKPAEMLAFIGIGPGMWALDVSAASGYTTELLARAVGPTGRVWGQVPPPPPASLQRLAQSEGAAAPPPAGAPPPLPTFSERKENPALAHMQLVRRVFENPAPPDTEGRFDRVTFMFNYHDTGHLGVDRAAMNRAIYAALKPGGFYVIADHAAQPGAGMSVSGTLHRVDEAFVVREVEAAGFRLVARGDFLRNPRDPRDRNTPVPPMPKDGFVLKFQKP